MITKAEEEAALILEAEVEEVAAALELEAALVARLRAEAAQVELEGLVAAAGRLEVAEQAVLGAGQEASNRSQFLHGVAAALQCGRGFFTNSIPGATRRGTRSHSSLSSLESSTARDNSARKLSKTSCTYRALP